MHRAFTGTFRLEKTAEYIRSIRYTNKNFRISSNPGMGSKTKFSRRRTVLTCNYVHEPATFSNDFGLKMRFTVPLYFEIIVLHR
jgi:hypothetical protein